MTIEDNIKRIKEIVSSENKIAGELTSLFNYAGNSEDKKEKDMVDDQTEKLKDSFKKINDKLMTLLEGTAINMPIEEKLMPKKKEPAPKKTTAKRSINISELTELDKEILKRLKKKKEKEVQKKEKKPSKYIKIANNYFSAYVKSIVSPENLTILEKDLIKANMSYTSVTYASMMAMTTVLAFGIAFVLFAFLLFFNVGPALPIITRTATNIGTRFLEIFWILILLPAGTFLFMYIYPTLEKKTVENKINVEIPFAAIHMAAIAGSQIEPTRIFQIISATGEYPALEREFNKLLNEINIYGYDFVTALKDLASNSPSQKLAELFNGLATTITSGGDLFEFFDKRAQTLLFDYRLDKEKATKSAETFMDIYISVVIAAPMILMLLLMMMKISGLGISLSTDAITFIVVGVVSLINVFFLIFLQVKNPGAI